MRHRVLDPLLVLTLLVGVAPGWTAAAAPDRAPTPTCDGVPATIVGTSNADVLRGTSGRDVIVGLDGQDEISALGGDDLVCGGRGVDFIDLGFGDDTVWGGSDGEFGTLQGDQITPGPGDDVVHGGPAPDEPAGIDRPEGRVLYLDAGRAIEASLPGNGAQGQIVGQGTDVVEDIFSVFGTEHDDTIVTGDGSHIIRGMGGDDTIEVGETRFSEVFGGPGHDVLRGGWFVHGGPGADRILGADNNAYGDGGDDVIVGTAHRNEIHSGPGDDRISTRGGRDHVFAERGDDVVHGGPGRDEVDGGPGDDRCRAETVRACES